MGSIAAVLAHDVLPADRAGDIVGRMLTAAPHRGARRLVHREAAAALGVATGDVADAWIAWVDGWSAAVTGHIDNLEELVPQDGDSSDPALSLLGLHRHRASQIPDLRGVFAAVVSDGRRLWAYRDHVGFAPLFYRVEPTTVYIATEPKQVAAGAGLVIEPDLEVVEAIFWSEHDDDTACAVQGVRRLPKATVLEAAKGNVTSSRYWHPETLLERGRVPQSELQERFDALMTQAVDRVLTDASVVALSGGIDSPAVAAYAAPRYRRRFGRPLPALSAVYPDLPSVDETRLIELAAGRFGMPLRTYRQQAGPLDAIGRFARLCDGPTPTVSLAEAAELYQLARESGYRTILTGEMAEYVMAVGSSTLDHLVWSGRLGSAIRFLAAERRRGIPPRLMSRRVVRALIPAEWLAARRRRQGRGRRFAVPWLDQERLRRRRPPPGNPWELQQLSGFLRPGLSLEADEFLQAACGVRVRRPWLDIDLWEFFLGLPADQKYPDGRYKSLTRGLLRGRVPAEILDRRTRTFFDESFLARIDYNELRRWLFGSDFRMPGVDYRVLAERLETGSLDLVELMRAKDLAVSHAFVTMSS